MAAKVSRHLVWHDLRHTGATALLGGYFGRKWKLEEIEHILGHKDIQTTQRYAHALQEPLDDAARATWGDIDSENGPEMVPPSQAGDDGTSGKQGHARSDSNRRHSASKATAIVNGNMVLRPSPGTIWGLPDDLIAAARQVRGTPSTRSRVRAALIEELTESVLSLEPFRIARELAESSEQCKREELAARLSEWVDPEAG